jgi:SRSO17 transposase
LTRIARWLRDLFPDVRSFEQFKLLHLGLIAELPRKSLPAISKAVGLQETQSLHHFVVNSPWHVAALRQHRLDLTKQALGGRAFTLCIDETGDKKKGKTTDYVAHQYIGNLGKITTGIVSVNAYGVLDNVTFPLLFTVFKPQKRLYSTDVYNTKPHLARALIQDSRAAGFHVDLVLADYLYGESGDFIAELLQLKLPFVVAIRRNHGVWLGPGERVRTTTWRTFERVFTNGASEPRYIREIVFGRRHTIRYYQLTTDPAVLPDESTQFVMTNLTGNVRHRLGNLYGLRTWIEYGFKQAKNELGWADYRVTAYDDIERWWELVMSA